MIDPATFEVIRHKLFRIIDEAVVTLKHVAGTSTTTEGHDLMVSLYRPDGGLLMSGVGFLHHLTSASEACKHIIREFFEDPGIFEDDIFFLNDPYIAALHTSDVYLISPIHYEGKLVGWSASFTHVTDIGAIDPGGFCPNAKEVFHEGFSSPGIKIMEKGIMRKDVWKTILNMVRDPDEVALDLKSQIAANTVAKQRVQELMKKYGFEVVDEVMQRLIDQSEMLLRRRLRELPDGTWRTRQYLDTVDKVYTINLALTKKGDSLIYDFTGSSEQAPIGVNSTYWATWGGLFAPLFPLLCYDITWNDGVTKPVTMIAPEGSIINCTRPAPTSIATVGAIQLVNNASLTVISKMLGSSTRYRKEATAVWHGSHFVTFLYGINQRGNFFIAPIVDTFGGSGGARTFKDGVDVGGEIPNTVSRWPNVETMELNFPILYVYRRMLKDSGGPGKFRGGVSTEYTIVPHDIPTGKIDAVLIGKGMESAQSLGLFGGYIGCNCNSIVVKDSDIHERIASGKIPESVEDVEGSKQSIFWGTVELMKNDFISIHYMGGGGYGDPLDRYPDLVQNDVILGLVSNSCAKEIHGVILDPQTHKVDLDATCRQRELIRKDRIKHIQESYPKGEEKVLIPLNEYLEVIKTEQGIGIRCIKCNKVLSSSGVFWKNYAVVSEFPLTKAGPRRSRTEKFVLREFYCPNCATLLDTEMVLKGYPPLHDEIFLLQEDL